MQTESYCQSVSNKRCHCFGSRYNETRSINTESSNWIMAESSRKSDYMSQRTVFNILQLLLHVKAISFITLIVMVIAVASNKLFVTLLKLKTRSHMKCRQCAGEIAKVLLTVHVSPLVRYPSFVYPYPTMYSARTCRCEYSLVLQYDSGASWHGSWGNIGHYFKF